MKKWVYGLLLISSIVGSTYSMNEDKENKEYREKHGLLTYNQLRALQQQKQEELLQKELKGQSEDPFNNISLEDYALKDIWQFHISPYIDYLESQKNHGMVAGTSSFVAELFNSSLFVKANKINNNKFEPIILSPDGSHILTKKDSAVSIKNTDNGSLVGTLQHDLNVDYASYGPDGNLIVTVSGKEEINVTITVWNNSFQKVCAFTLRSYLLPYYVQISSDNSKILIVSIYKKLAEHCHYVLIYDSKTGKLIHCVQGEGKMIYDDGYIQSKMYGFELNDNLGFVFSQDGSKILIPKCQDNGNSIVDIKDTTYANGKNLLRISLKGQLVRARFSPDGNRVLTLCTNNKHSMLQMTDMVDGSIIFQKKFTQFIQNIEFSLDGMKILVCPKYYLSLHNQNPIFQGTWILSSMSGELQTTFSDINILGLSLDNSTMIIKKYNGTIRSILKKPPLLYLQPKQLVCNWALAKMKRDNHNKPVVLKPSDLTNVYTSLPPELLKSHRVIIGSIAPLVGLPKVAITTKQAKKKYKIRNKN